MNQDNAFRECVRAFPRDVYVFSGDIAAIGSGGFVASDGSLWELDWEQSDILWFGPSLVSRGI
jgi:hypothetical protein